uniref:B box-type domain-containing protein n=2 Tax=Phytophthora fragariae TaxID=53985 RepID=A0A6A3ERL1_9STRA|nr:hypothetical protein PF009_g14993 [Phytophthora fragariae]
MPNSGNRNGGQLSVASSSMSSTKPKNYGLLVRRAGLTPGVASVVFLPATVSVAVGGMAAFYSVVLRCSTAPEQVVTVAPVNLPSGLRVFPTMHIFTQENWFEPQFFRVAAVNGGVFEELRGSAAVIEHTTSSLDPRFHGRRVLHLPSAVQAHVNPRDGYCLFATGKSAAFASQKTQFSLQSKPKHSLTVHEFTEVELRRSVLGSRPLVARCSILIPMAPGAMEALAAVEAANQATAFAQSRRKLSTTVAVVKAMTATANLEEPTTAARVSQDHNNALVRLTSHGDKTLALYHDGEMLVLGSSEISCSSTRNSRRDSGTDAALSRMLLDVACGDHHVVGASEQGYLLTWGDVCETRPRNALVSGDVEAASAMEFPKVVHSLLHKRIVQVACGASHSFALAEDGDVFSWGVGRSGALGHGLNAVEQTFDTVSTPMEVLTLKGRRVVQIACGDMHSAALLASGELLTCGQRDHGRLGRQSDIITRNSQRADGGECSSWFSPVVFPQQGVKCTYVACGAAHTLVIGGPHELYAFGLNSSGQLGVGDCRDRFTPTRVTYFDAVSHSHGVTLPALTIASVVAGALHSLASSPDGRLFAWGNDEMGQCGLTGEAHSAVLTSHAHRHLETLERTQPTQYAQLGEHYENAVKDDAERRAHVLERAKRQQLDRVIAARRRKPPLDPATEAITKMLLLQSLIDQDAAMDVQLAVHRRPQTARAAFNRSGGGEDDNDKRHDGTVHRVRCSSASMLLQGARVDLRRWSVIVSDRTLRRIAAHNHRISSANRKAQKLQGLLAGQRQSSFLLRTEEVEALSSSYLDARNQPTESLLLTGAETITDAGVASIALAVPKLKELTIAGAVRVTDASLRVVGEYCPSLERLDFSALSGMRGAGLAALVDHCGASLTHLSLADCPQLGDWVLRRCLYACPKLTHLNLSRCPQVGDALIETLAAQCPLLRKLELSGCLQVSDRGVVRIARSSPNLEYVALDRPIGVRGGEQLTDSSCSALGEYCPSLRFVSLAGNSALTDAGVQWMASRCAQLTRLDLTGAIGLTDATCAALGAGCPELRVLRINGVKGISDVGLRLLAAGCAKLELLHAANLYLVSDGSNRDFGLEGLRAIASRCPELQDLNLSGCFQLQERALVAIGASCPALRRLSLQACPDVTFAAVTAVLKGCKKLTRLDISGVRRCDDRMLRAIAKYGAAITQLAVAGCDRVGDAGLRYLAGARADQLELLDFTGCRLVTDAGINALCDAFQRPKLAHLVLEDCPLVTQDPIARLAFACPQLLTLSVHGCRVSARVLQSLSSSWPFGELHLPPSGTQAGSNTPVGIFPAPRAKDRRFVAEFCTLWTAAATIQNLYRARVARRHALSRREVAFRNAVVRKLQSIWRGRQARREASILKMKFSHREYCATLIQRRYRATRQARRVENEMRDSHEKQLLVAATLVQQRFRATRAGREARRIVARRRREFARETQAAVKVQRHFRRRVQRNKLRLMQAKKLACSRRERAASIQIQRRYRGRRGRRQAFDLREEQRLFFELQQRCAVRVQAQFRRVRALREVARRRNAITDCELAATKLQTLFRARRGRETAGLLALVKQRREQDVAARRLQRHWRARHDRLALVMVAEARRIRNQQRSDAATVLQRAIRTFLLRRRARNIVRELLEVQQRAEEMKRWASTLVQSYWRRRQAHHRVREERKIQRTRWKQLVDTYNQHGAGYGAPFFYNQVNGEIRWRLPRDLLSLTVRPTCAQCETPDSASFECSTCSEFFCDHCDVVVHGGGKRRLHNKRKLFDFYGRRRDYGDGEFPSIWPSEILQDAARGYDFEKLVPRDSYQDMLWEISRFVPVSTGNWDDELAAAKAAEAATSPAVALAFATMLSESASAKPNNTSTIDTDSDGLGRPSGPKHHLLYREQDFDENGGSLWESFYDYGQEEYRYYHRISKRVVTQLPGQAQQ